MDLRAKGGPLPVKLGLGTVQFGLDYGISNRGGMTPRNEVSKMLRMARDAGVRCLDTAPAYASSEEALGECLPAHHEFQIVTKTLKSDLPLGEVLQTSLARLRVPSVYGLLVHDADTLDDAMYSELRRARDAGLVEKIGVSVYTAAQIDHVLGRFAIDLIQVPLSLVDQRLLRSGHLDRLKEHSVEIHARSIFLQGLLLMPPASLPSHFDSVRTALADLKDQFGSVLVAALSFVLSLPQIDRAIVGACNTTELSQLIDAANAPKRIVDAARLAWSDEQILNPAKWPRR